MKDFRRPKSWILGTAVERTGPVSAKVQLSTGEVIRRHQDQIRIRKDSVPTPEADKGNQDIPLAETPLLPSEVLPAPAVHTPISPSPSPSVTLQPATGEAELGQALLGPPKRRSTRIRQRPKRFGD